MTPGHADAGGFDNYIQSCLKNEPGSKNLYSDHANPLKYSSRAVATGKDCPCVLL